MTHNYSKYLYGRDLNCHHLDLLRLDSDHFKNLRLWCGLTRPELAKILRISPRTVRKYENDNHAPHWYFLILRVFAGDLSIFGHHWHGFTVHPNGSLNSSKFRFNVYPFELDAKMNRDSMRLRKIIRDLSIELSAAKENRPVDNVIQLSAFKTHNR